MKNTIYRLLLVVTTISAVSCKDLIIIPERGSINGYVTDNNGAPLAGVQVSATFTAPSQSQGQQSFPTTLTAQTDNSGYYQLSELWDDVTVSVQQQGFQPTITLIDLSENDQPSLNITLSGSPTIGTVNLNKTTFISGQADTLSVRMEVQDLYNSNSQGYTGNFLLKTDGGVIASIINATLLSESLNFYLFKGAISTEELPAGTYGIQAEVRDPDGNMHRIDLAQHISVE